MLFFLGISAHNGFLLFFHPNLHVKQRRSPDEFFDSDEKRFFCEVFEICRHFVSPFALISSRLDCSRDVGSRTLIPYKPSDLVVSFSIVENISWKMAVRCVAARCTNVADPKKNISMHKILFFGEEPIKKKRRKRWINFVLEK